MAIVSTSCANNSFLTREIFVSGSDSGRVMSVAPGLTLLLGASEFGHTSSRQHLSPISWLPQNAGGGRKFRGGFSGLPFHDLKDLCYLPSVKKDALFY